MAYGEVEPLHGRVEPFFSMRALLGDTMLCKSSPNVTEQKGVGAPLIPASPLFHVFFTTPSCPRWDMLSSQDVTLNKLTNLSGL